MSELSERDTIALLLVLINLVTDGQLGTITTEMVDKTVEMFENGEICFKSPWQPEIVRCKDCKHNPKDTWFECPMSHLSEKQRPETAWCWKGERRTDA